MLGLQYFGTFLLIVLGIWLLCAGALYVLYSAGLYTMARNAGMGNPWLAWVPIARDYVLGGLCDRAAYTQCGRRWNFSVLLPVLNGAGLLLGVLPQFSSWTGVLTGYGHYRGLSDGFFGISSIATLAAFVFSTIALYHLYRDYAPGAQVALTIVTVFFSWLTPAVAIFVLRNRAPASVTGPGWPSQPRYDRAGGVPPYDYGRPYGPGPDVPPPPGGHPYGGQGPGDTPGPEV